VLQLCSRISGAIPFHMIPLYAPIIVTDARCSLGEPARPHEQLTSSFNWDIQLLLRTFGVVRSSLSQVSASIHGKKIKPWR
jgi:hypothetical protein